MICFIIIGIATGLFTGFYSCQNHIRSSKGFELATLFGPTSAISLFVAFISKGFEIKQDDLIALSSSYILTTAITFFFLLIMANLNKQNYGNCFYELFYSKIDDYKKIIEDSKKSQDILNHQKKMLEDILNEAKANTICYELPVNEKQPVNDPFVKQIPLVFKNIISFIDDMNEFERRFYKDFTVENLSDCEKIDRFKELLNAISRNLIENVFNRNETRVHFRYLNLVSYNQLTVFPIGSIGETITKIPVSSDTLIGKAAAAKKSVIKSVNEHKEGFHFNTKHSYKWPEYVTLVFDKFFDDENPIITMGISLASTETYKNQIHFLNFCELENVIQRYLVTFNKKIKISSIINSVIISENQGLSSGF